MALGLIEDTTLTGIADAIRAKTGKSDLIPTSQMSTEIASIPEPTPPPVIQELNVTQNGTYEVPEGVDGYNPVVVNVSGEPEPPDDGKTRLYITVPANAMEGFPPPRNQVPLYIQQTVDRGVTIDWGDGGEPETLPGTGNVNTTHTYEQAGDYVISLDPSDGCELGFGRGTNGYCVMGSTENNNKVYCAMLHRVVIGRAVTKITNYAFSNCLSIFEVKITDSVKSIGNYSFEFCKSIFSYYIPKSVLNIYLGSFRECSSVSSITIQNNVESIEGFAFGNCFGVKEYHILATTPPSLSAGNVFSGIPSDCIIYVPVGSLEAYQTATNWSTYADQMQEEPA